jgi:penicillin-binding protein 1B
VRRYRRDTSGSGEPPRPRPLRRQILIAVGAFVGILLLVGGVYANYLMHTLGNFRYASKGWKFPSFVYADWLTLTPGAPLSRERVLDELHALEYRPVLHAPRGPGEMREIRQGIELWTRTFQFPDDEREATAARITWRGAAIASVTTANGKRPLSDLRLEPVKIAELHDAERQERTYVRLDQVPKSLRDAVVVSEDRRFYHHAGLDFRGLARALMKDVRAGGVVEGGSTLTQQTVKNVFLSQKRTVWRKVTEAALAVVMDVRYSKEQILELYLNQIYLGQWGPSSIGGVESASRFYFGKHVQELTLPESALLAGLIPGPNLYSPHRNKPAALRRRNTVLRDMLDESYITPKQYEIARHAPLGVIHEPPLPRTSAPYFIDYASETLAKQFSRKALAEQGLRIFTTLDRPLETLAESTLAHGVRDARRRIAWRRDSVQVDGALVALDPGTGAVRALVGGSSYAESQFNRATDANRQPGSAFKPIVYAAALDTPNRPGATVVTPSTILEDTPTEFASPEGPWKPRNYEGRYLGRATVRRALYMSLNVATVHLSQLIGLAPVIEYAHRLGISSELRPVPSLALGVCEVTPLELTNAFATLAAGGVRSQPYAVRAVLDMRGKVLWRPELRRVRVLSAETAYVTTTLLEDVLNHGTAFPARGQYGFTAPAAGKTGTTNDEVDSWFVGYTPSLVAGVWIGADHGGHLGLTGAQAALPVWATFMRTAERGRPAEDFAQPPGVQFATIDSDTGLLARADCPRVVRQAFIHGTAPAEYCTASHEPQYEEYEMSLDDSTAVDTMQEQEQQPPPDEEAPPDTLDTEPQGE